MDAAISKSECCSSAVTTKSRPATLNVGTDHVSIAILKASAVSAIPGNGGDASVFPFLLFWAYESS